jgi:hypothetical protein
VTYKNCNIMYGGMINTFNKVITHLEKESVNTLVRRVRIVRRVVNRYFLFLL